MVVVVVVVCWLRRAGLAAKGCFVPILEIQECGKVMQIILKIFSVVFKSVF